MKKYMMEELYTLHTDPPYPVKDHYLLSVEVKGQEKVFLMNGLVNQLKEVICEQKYCK